MEERAKTAPAHLGFLEHMVWGREKVIRALRARHRAFSLHDTWEIDQLKQNGVRTREIFRDDRFPGLVPR